MLDPAGPVAAGERLILFDSLAIMLAIVIPTIVAVAVFAWWFRAGNARARYLPDWEYSGQLELLVWSVPALVVIFLGGIAWVASHKLDPARPLAASNALKIEVVSLDWKWLFVYPDQGIASVNRLVVPVGRPVSFRLTSATVMNSFFVPRLGSQIYTMAGMTTALNLRADQAGRYRGFSANYSGKGFPGMTFPVDAMTAGDFDKWTAAAGAQGPTLDDTAYQALEKPSENVAPFTYRAIVPKLFDIIVMRSGMDVAHSASGGRGH